MNRESCAGTRDSVTGLQIDNSFADRENRPGAAVARTLRQVETAPHRLHRRKDSVPLHFADDFPHQIGPGFCFLQQILLRKLCGGALGSSGHDRGRDAHQHAPRQKLRCRNFRHLDLARTHVL